MGMPNLELFEQWNKEDNMKITVEKLKAAIEKNGFPLVRATYARIGVDGKYSCGCAITHMYCAATERQPIKPVVYGLIGYPNDEEPYMMAASNIIAAWAVKTYGSAFMDGFYRGFDSPNVTLTKTYLPEYIEGFENGKHLAQALLPC